MKFRHRRGLRRNLTEVGEEVVQIGSGSLGLFDARRFRGNFRNRFRREIDDWFFFHDRRRCEGGRLDDLRSLVDDGTPVGQRRRGFFFGNRFGIEIKLPIELFRRFGLRDGRFRGDFGSSRDFRLNFELNFFRLSDRRGSGEGLVEREFFKLRDGLRRGNFFCRSFGRGSRGMIKIRQEVYRNFLFRDRLWFNHRRLRRDGRSIRSPEIREEIELVGAGARFRRLRRLDLRRFFLNGRGFNERLRRGGLRFARHIDLRRQVEFRRRGERRRLVRFQVAQEIKVLVIDLRRARRRETRQVESRRGGRIVDRIEHRQRCFRFGRGIVEHKSARGKHGGLAQRRGRSDRRRRSG